MTLEEQLQQAEAERKKHEAAMQTFEAEVKKASNERNAADCGRGIGDALHKAYAEMQQAESNFYKARLAKLRTNAKIKRIKSSIADQETSQYEHFISTLA
jgi:hypothetical protein